MREKRETFLPWNILRLDIAKSQAEIFEIFQDLAIWQLLILNKLWRFNYILVVSLHAKIWTRFLLSMLFIIVNPLMILIYVSPDLVYQHL